MDCEVHSRASPFYWQSITATLPNQGKLQRWQVARKNIHRFVGSSSEHVVFCEKLLLTIVQTDPLAKINFESTSTLW